jgi:hypothetical protein
MLGGHKDNFLMEVGNAINRNHFQKASKDPTYHHILVDYKQGVAEGRQTLAFFEEMRGKMRPDMFSMLYECKFPDAEMIDTEGYSPLITENQLMGAYVELTLFGDLRMGVDVAGGGDNYSTITIRGENGAKNLWRERTEDTMVLVSKIKEFAEANKIAIDDEHIFIDKTGAGMGLCNRMSELYGGNFGIFAGSSPENKEVETNYINLRAQMYWRLADWMGKGGRVWPKPNFDELLGIRYKVQSDKKIKIKSKLEMLKDGIQSPDVADSLSLTFAIANKPFYSKSFKQNAYQPQTDWGI